jgi:hypothetical protein
MMERFRGKIPWKFLFISFTKQMLRRTGEEWIVRL